MDCIILGLSVWLPDVLYSLIVATIHMMQWLEAVILTYSPSCSNLHSSKPLPLKRSVANVQRNPWLQPESDDFVDRPCSDAIQPLHFATYIIN